jgi:hypothetical protein
MDRNSRTYVLAGVAVLLLGLTWHSLEAQESQPRRVKQRAEDDQNAFFRQTFADYAVGDKYAPDVFVQKGKDGRKWLVSAVDGAHPAGEKVQFPDNFFLEMDFSAQIGQDKYGMNGDEQKDHDNHKAVVTSSVALIDKDGEDFRLRWKIDSANQTFTLPGNVENSLSSEDFIKAAGFYREVKWNDLGRGHARYYHDYPRAWWWAGKVRIVKRADVVKVLVNGELVVSGNIEAGKKLVRFEIRVYNWGKDVSAGKDGVPEPTAASWLYFTNFRGEKLGGEKVSGKAPVKAGKE